MHISFLTDCEINDTNYALCINNGFIISNSTIHTTTTSVHMFIAKFYSTAALDIPKIEKTTWI